LHFFKKVRFFDIISLIKLIKKNTAKCMYAYNLLRKWTLKMEVQVKSKDGIFGCKESGLELVEHHLRLRILCCTKTLRHSSSPTPFWGKVEWNWDRGRLDLEYVIPSVTLNFEISLLYYRRIDEEDVTAWSSYYKFILFI
jgi:hypothetical protein